MLCTSLIANEKLMLPEHGFTFYYSQIQVYELQCSHDLD